MARFWYGRSGKPKSKGRVFRVCPRRFRIDFERTLEPLGSGPIGKCPPVVERFARVTNQMPPSVSICLRYGRPLVEKTNGTKNFSFALSCHGPPMGSAPPSKRQLCA